MNKLLSLTIIISMLSVFCVGAMDRPEGAVYQTLTPQQVAELLRRERDERIRAARERQEAERNLQPNPHARRQLFPRAQEGREGTDPHL